NFNIDRPKVSDEEINRHKDFDKLVKQFKERSLKQAQGDESWWKNKKVQYTTMIAGVTVICTVSYFTLFKNQSKQKNTHETLITSKAPDKKNKKPFINSPSQKLKVPYSTYQVNNAKGGSITHPSTSKISIPENSFVDQQGKDVIGDVTIEYREFHDIGDIVASGIPMAYDSAGTHYNLESAGMFDIKGSQNGEPVFIKPEKNIEVQLASSNTDNRFNQYYLDTAAGNWQYLQKDNATPVSTQSKKTSTAKTKQEDLSKTSPKLLALKHAVEVLIPKHIDSVTTLYTKKAAQLPKAKEPLKPAQPSKGRPTFRLDGSYSEFPELAAFDNVIFEVGPENSNYTKEMHEITWSDVKVTQGPVKGKNYVLNLTYRNRSEKLVVYPVLTGADFAKAQSAYENKFAEYEELVEKRRAAEQRLMTEMQAKQEAYLAEQKKKQLEYETEKAKLFAKYDVERQNEIAGAFKTMSNANRAVSLFNVSRFGIFNSDCPHKTPEGTSVNPVFVLDNRGNFISPDFIYLIEHRTKSVYTLNAQDAFKITYTPGNDYTICVFKQNKLYLCSRGDFQQAVASGTNKFPVKILAGESENLVDFKKALEI
ncbi:MAG TPA: hypothetical protein PL029_05875, partial [Bacteroidia bacterium]|nr:hypothetical protein [Bacteroidia bacterium]